MLDNSCGILNIDDMCAPNMAIEENTVLENIANFFRDIKRAQMKSP